jgi:hypothetical protein
MKPQVPIALLLAVICCTVMATPSSAAHDYYGVASRGTSAAAVGDSGQIIFSSLGPHTDWTGSPAIIPYSLFAISTTSGGYTACGELGKIYRNANGDGIVWMPVSSRIPFALFGVARAGQYLVAVGDSGSITIGDFTQDQSAWNRADTVQTHVRLRGVAGGSSYTAAVGRAGTVLWSVVLNPTVWKPPSSVPTTEDLYGVALGPNQEFWAVGGGGTILRSLPNPALAWTQIASGVTTSTLRAVTFFGLIGVAVGDDGTILYSNGGDSWSPVDSPTSETLNGVAYTGSGAGGGFVAVGNSGTVLWSEFGTTWTAGAVPVRKASWGSMRHGWR